MFHTLILLVSTSATLFLLAGLIAIGSIPILWHCRRMRLRRRERMLVEDWIRDHYDESDSLVATIVFRTVAQKVGVDMAFLRPSDRFDSDLAISKWRMIDSLCRGLDLGWDTVEEDIDHHLQIASADTTAVAVLQGSIDDAIHSLVGSRG
jgi:hypothetical protein